MDYIAILSLILGLVSVVITLQFIKYYDSFDNKLTKVNIACSSKNLPSAIFEVQDILNISDKDFNDSILKNKNSIAAIIKKKLPNTIKQSTAEEFTNYSYLNTNSRNLDNINTSILIQKSSNNCILKKRNYKIDIKQSKIGADKLTPEIPLYPIHKEVVNYQVDNDTNGLRYNFIQNNWCVVNHDDKNYCFAITNKKNCPSKIIVKNRDICSY